METGLNTKIPAGSGAVPADVRQAVVDAFHELSQTHTITAQEDAPLLYRFDGAVEEVVCKHLKPAIDSQWARIEEIVERMVEKLKADIIGRGSSE